jgi:hypothetical protein
VRYACSPPCSHLSSVSSQSRHDNLWIVHIGKDERWKVGGPLISDLESALADYPHRVIHIEDKVRERLADFIDRQGIHVLVVGEHFPGGGAFKINSVTDWVKQNVPCPFIVIRPGAVRNERMRLPGAPPATATEGGAGRDLSPARSSSPRLARRKLLIAYNSFHVGAGLIDAAKRSVLLPGDDVYVAHVFPTQTGAKLVGNWQLASLSYALMIIFTNFFSFPYFIPPIFFFPS